MILVEENIDTYKTKCIKLPKDLKDWNAYNELKTELDSLKLILPIIIDLKKPSIR